MATHSSILAWRILWTEEPGGLLSIRSHRVGHDWSDLAGAAAATADFTQLSLVFPFMSFFCSGIPSGNHVMLSSIALWLTHRGRQQPCSSQSLGLTMQALVWLEGNPYDHRIRSCDHMTHALSVLPVPCCICTVPLVSPNCVCMYVCVFNMKANQHFFGPLLLSRLHVLLITLLYVFWWNYCLLNQ